MSLARDQFDGEDVSAEWAIVRWRFHEPYIFQIFKDGVEIVPHYPMDIDSDTGEIVNLLDHTDRCGAAIYDNQWDTIRIMFNKDPDCDLNIVMVSAIKVEMKFDLSYDDFFSNGHDQTFTSGVADFLGISMDRIRIVNIRAGSTIIDYYIMPDSTPSVEDSESSDQTGTITDLETIQSALDDGVFDGSLDFGDLGTPTSYFSEA